MFAIPLTLPVSKIAEQFIYKNALKKKKKVALNMLNSVAFTLHNVQGTKYWLAAQLKNEQQKLISQVFHSLEFLFLNSPPLVLYRTERKIKN